MACVGHAHPGIVRCYAWPPRGWGAMPALGWRDARSSCQHASLSHTDIQLAGQVELGSTRASEWLATLHGATAGRTQPLNALTPSCSTHAHRVLVRSALPTKAFLSWVVHTRKTLHASRKLSSSAMPGSVAWS
jgi:hypothetical protein